jgi:hypothetical protein
MKAAARDGMRLAAILNIVASAAILLVLPAFSLPADAQDMPVPALVQARFFNKVFAYNKTLPKGAAQIKIAVIFSDASGEAKDDITEAFTSLGFTVTALKPAQLSGATGIHVVYAAPGVDLKPIKSYCSSNGVLSITGIPKWVKDGELSIAIDAVNEQPKVVANADRLKTERQDAPELMRFR